MKISTYNDCLKEYNNSNSAEKWDSQNDIDRQSILKVFPYSLIVEGDTLEWIMAKTWSQSNIGEKTKTWDELPLGKTDYDYGFFEFYFKDKKDLDSFTNEVQNFYAENEGKKWKTKGRFDDEYLTN
jgi:hypothetical protein